MLEPNSRRALLEALKPPDGYALDFALGTTYSLDLPALLMAPLAFTFFDLAAADDGPAADPIAVLEAVRRNSSKIAVFVQAGQIKIPVKRNQTLYAELEKCVYEVQPADPKAVFHPKQWVLRFKQDREVIYRLLCSSRNLTFDRSWDTLLVTEGKLTGRERAFSRFTPLSDLIRELPKMTHGGLPEAVRTQVRRIQEEVRLTAFETPEGFDDMAFHVLGPDGCSGFPRELPQRLLIVSPFVDDRFLPAIAENATKSILVSRDEELRRLKPSTLARFSKVYCLNSDAHSAEGDEPESERDTRLEGLHSKLYIAEYGWNAWVISGSANATEAAFNRNYEFLVGLKGKASKFGIKNFIDPDNPEVGIHKLLVEFQPDDEQPDRDTEQERLERQADRLSKQVALAGLEAIASPATMADTYDLRLKVLGDDLPVVPTHSRLTAWPITLTAQQGGRFEVRAGFESLFPGVSFEALTSFFAFELTLEMNGRTASRRFVVNVPVSGFPDDRSERLLRCLIKGSDDLLRLIQLILSENAGWEERMSAFHNLQVEGWQRNGFEVSGLFESLVRSLATHPWKLDHIHRIITELRKTTDGSAVLPAGFDEVWNPIWEARKALRDE